VLRVLTFRNMTTWLYLCYIYRVLCWNAPQTPVDKRLHAPYDESNGSVEFLQQYPSVVADALLEICTTVISAYVTEEQDYVTEEHFSVLNFVISRCAFRFDTLLSGYALRHVLWTAANDVDVKWRPAVSTRSARKYTVFAPA
jgi:hypothetical protein